jgi:hypothetical protein
MILVDRVQERIMNIMERLYKPEPGKGERKKKPRKNYIETFIHSLSSVLSDQINPSNLFLVKLNPLFSIY